MSQAYFGVRVAITGSNGFIGAHLVRALDAAGAIVTRLDRPTFDLADTGTVVDAIHQARPDVVFHLAATGVADLFADQARQIALNTLGTLAVLEGARRASVGRVVCFGSCFEYGPSLVPMDEGSVLSPRNPYAASKAAAFALVRHAADVLHQDAVWLRPFAVYGPGQPQAKLVPALIRSICSGVTLELGPGDAAWDYIHVEDVAAAALVLGSEPRAAFGVFNAGTGHGATARQIAARIERFAGKSGHLGWGARPGRAGDPAVMISNSRRLRALGWLPRWTLQEGLRSLLDSEALAA